ncbi:hypothetical protein D5086_023635 [Populus alba]|uniref:KIB1-4 beta-propeller domain-containing protein n=2 Tax=Populus alba TaxID=43335 RepID=A0A4U5MHH0_POPAL|nr:hypothetical protein D5086_0000307060 [Populus alba]
MEVNTTEEEEEQSLQCWPPAVGLLPCLVFFHGSSEKGQTFYDISECRCHVKNIPGLQGKQIGTCSYGWLVIAGDSISDDCFLLNPISTKKIQLPSLAPDFTWTDCVLSSPPHRPECVVMFLNFGFGILNVKSCKPGDVEWAGQDLELHDEWFDDSDWGLSVGVHKGDIYILTCYEHLYFVEFNKSCGITLVDLKVDDSTSPITRSFHSDFPTYLVETCGELLRVHCYILHGQLMDISVLACSTEEPRIQGNRIYLTLPEDRSLYVYDLDLCCLEVCLPCPNVKADWIENDWILPLLEDK